MVKIQLLWVIFTTQVDVIKHFSNTKRLDQIHTFPIIEQVQIYVSIIFPIIRISSEFLFLPDFFAKFSLKIVMEIMVERPYHFIRLGRLRIGKSLL